MSNPSITALEATVIASAMQQLDRLRSLDVKARSVATTLEFVDVSGQLASLVGLAHADGSGLGDEARAKLLQIDEQWHQQFAKPKPGTEEVGLASDEIPLLIYGHSLQPLLDAAGRALNERDAYPCSSRDWTMANKRLAEAALQVVDNAQALLNEARAEAVR